MTNKPVIFLAFANDHERPGGHLPKLAEEARQLQNTLDQAAQAGLCEVLVHQNVTIATVLDVFQDARYRNRIAIFHYGGHAESYALLLETAAGQPAIADAGGLAAFLGQQTGIQLVFLNGCSSQPQAQGLLDAGVAAVIATAQAIDDAVAVEFAARFYKGLASGATLQTAFHEAAAACQTAHGNQPRHLYFHELLSDASVVMADRWPWALTARPGAELALHWNLPEAVHDPLFGLPQPARCDLPASPYRYLDWYRREDAEVFFGRGYEIRELYQRVTAPDAPPLLLYYGQSGVGKSSLLAAGLLPRLGQVQTVIYARRDQARGLAGTLAAALPEAAAGESLLARWRDFEAQSGQPLTLILDQVEEAYTRPHPDRPGELAEFLDLLTALFRDPAARAQGRLILSFRKEWLAEIEKLVAERQLPRAKVFLQRLARRGILETITGPARVERLRQHFGLTVSDDLPGEIADDLLADPSAAVTTTLQVLLSKLWEQAKERDYDHPTFDRALYQELRRKGLLLSDFLEQQLAALRAAQPGAVESGLVFDLLAFHTTPQSTAEQRALAELHAAYAHQEPVLPELLGACQDLYLLTDPAKNQPDVKQVSRLAHDTLAPLVRHRFDESDAPGQRARRILESRLSAETEAQAALEPLGEGDLALVEAGQAGMRAWREPEVNLIGLSRAARARRRKRDRIVRGVLLALVCVIVVVAGVAAWQARRADEQAAVALTAQATAEAEAENARIAEEQARLEAENARLAEATAVAEQERAEQQAQVALARQLTAQAQTLWNQLGQSPELLSRAVLLALQSLHSYPESDANQIVADGRARLPLPERQIAHEGVSAVAFSADGQWMISNSYDGTTRLWEVATWNEVAHLTHGGDYMNRIAFSADSQWVASGGCDESENWQCLRSSVQIWEVTTGNKVLQLPHDSSIFAVAFSPNGQRIATCSADDIVRVWDISLSPANVAFAREIAQMKGCGTALAFSPDSQWVTAGKCDELDMYHNCLISSIRIWKIETQREVARIRYQGSSDELAFSPDGRRLISTGCDIAQGENCLTGSARIWDVIDGNEITRLQYDNFVLSAAFSPDGKWVVSRNGDGTVQIWDATTGDIAAQQSCGEWVNAVSFNPNGQWIAVSCRNTIHVWDISTVISAMTGREVSRLTYEGPVNAAAFNPDGQWVISAGCDAVDYGHCIGSSARVWEAATGREIAHMTYDVYVKTVAFSSDGRLAFSGGCDESDVMRPWICIKGSARVWEARNEHEVAWLIHEGDMRSIAFSQNGQWAASAGCDAVGTIASCVSGSTRVLNIAEALRFNQASILEIARLEQPNAVRSVIFSPDGQWIASSGEYEDKIVRVWQTITGREVARLPHGGYVRAVAFSPDGKWLVTGNSDGLAQVWDISTAVNSELNLDESSGIATGRVLAQMRHEGLIVDIVAFSPDGQWIVSASCDGYDERAVCNRSAVRVWEAATGREIARMTHESWITAVAFSPDGRWVVSGSDDGTARVWEAATGVEIARMTHEETISAVAFSPDGRWVVSGSYDGTARVWWWQPEDLIRLACERLTRNLTYAEWRQYLGDEPYRCTCQNLPPDTSVIEAGMAIAEDACPVMSQP